MRQGGGDLMVTVRVKGIQSKSPSTRDSSRFGGGDTAWT